jgi:hypothetical protein
MNTTTDDRVHTGAHNGGTGVGVPVGSNEKNYPGNRRKDYHPILFGLLTAFSIIELGLTAYWARRGHREGWPSSRFRSSDIFLLVISVWTLIFSLMYMIFILTRATHRGASLGSSAIWLFITSILWGIATGLYSTSRPSCGGLFSSRFFSNCRIGTAIEVFGWLTFATLVLTLLSTVHHSGRHHGRANTSRYGQTYV